MKSAFSFFALLLVLNLPTHARADFAWDEIDESIDREVSPAEKAEILSQKSVKPTSESELQKQTSALFANKGKWTFKFTLIKDNGEEIPLTEQDPKHHMIPASIQKLFPGYIGYKKKKYKTSYIAHMLHESDCPEAQNIYNGVGGKIGVVTYLTKTMNLKLPPDLRISDGSGEDVTNRTSAEFMVSYLTQIHSDAADYASFKTLLAQPGEYGTLENRLKTLEGSVFAKTGSMKNTFVASLAGYVETKMGTLVFSVIGYNYPKATEADKITYPNCDSTNLNRRSICIARHWIDEAVKTHADWLNASPELPTPLPALRLWTDQFGGGGGGGGGGN